jgi:glucose dehydrogenase
VQANKNGWLYILDRATGKPILGIPEKKQLQSRAAHTFATQPIPVGQPFAKQCPEHRAAWAKLKAPDGKPFVVGCTYLPYDTTRWTVSAPSFLGGADWAPSAYSPDTGMMYICSKESSQVWASEDLDTAKKLSPLGNFQQIKSLPKGFKSPVGDVTGTLVAMNLRTNRIAWKRSWKHDICYSGVTVTAGGLVFVGRNTPRLQAYDAKNGTLVWTSPKLPGAADAPPMVYMANGKEYVAVYAGGNGLAASLFPALRKPHFSKYMVVFSL